MSSTEEEIRQMEAQNNEQPTVVNDDGDGGGESVDGDGQDGSVLDGIPVPSLTRRQAMILAAVVVAVLLWKMRDSSSGDSDGSEELKKMREESVEGQAEMGGDDEDDTIHVPANPDDELKKDQAVLDALKENGTMVGE